ncbi:MAG: FAD-dependent oxidoreductase, partial [Acidobacteriota bacterium]
ALAARLKQLRAALYLGHTAVSLRPGSPSLVTIQDDQGQIRVLEADKVLVCVGGSPNTSGLGIQKLGVNLDSRGFIPVNSRMETAVAGIHAVGDVTGPPLLAHKAYRQAKIVAEVISGVAASFYNAVIPGAIYTDPELAWAGICEEEARKMGLDIITGTFPFRASGRALTLNAPEGFVKTIADAKTSQLKGVLMMGQGVSEIISEAALALEMGASLQDLHANIHPHPTLSEALVESVDAALGQAVHILNRQAR